MITLIVGAQYGGEGKGKVTSYLATNRKYDVVCRCGGVNSSHTVVHKGREIKLRMMPATAVVDPTCTVVFGAGSLLHLQTLFEEIRVLNYDRRRILIDPLAGVVSDHCVELQRQDAEYQKLGSTLTGTGYATALRALRRLKLAGEYPELKEFLLDTAKVLHEAAKHKKRIMVEGHQGAGLSNYHGDYPFTSSRDCIAAALLSELGLGLGWDYETVLVVKLFPTRNHPGNLYGELSKEDADVLGIREFGGGSWGIDNRRRRVGTLNFDDLRRAVQLNTPDYIALTGFDYHNPILRDKRQRSDLENDDEQFVETIEKQTNCKIGLISTGPETLSMINFLEPSKPGRSNELLPRVQL